MITGDGCWAEVRHGAASPSPGPALLLDRDGVLIEDTGYPSRAADVLLIPEVVALVAAASVQRYKVAVITNQSGIGRGLFGWPEFQAVQAVIDAAVAAAGGRIDAVFACPFHVDASVPAFRRDHPWRKPAPGMIVAATTALNIEPARSVFVGDNLSDMVAAQAGLVAHRFLLGQTAAGGIGFDRIRRADCPTLLERTRVAPAASMVEPNQVGDGRGAAT